MTFARLVSRPISNSVRTIGSQSGKYIPLVSFAIKGSKTMKPTTRSVTVYYDRTSVITGSCETLPKHMVSRHPPTPANLSPTESTPPSSISLTSSALWSHDQESMSICTKCNKEYKSGSELTQHFKRSSEHPTCVQCGTGLFDDLAFLEVRLPS